MLKSPFEAPAMNRAMVPFQQVNHRTQRRITTCAPTHVAEHSPSMVIEGGQTMPISISTIVMGTHLVVAVADRIPTFDIARSCKLDTADTPGPPGAQAYKNCVDDENDARKQLMSQWSTFSASSKAECIPMERIGDDPSYVSLLTCLQMNLWGR